MWKQKKKIIENYLPMWCRGELMEENKRLEQKIQAQENHIEHLTAYLRGMQYAIRNGTKITVKGGIADREYLECHCRQQENSQL